LGIFITKLKRLVEKNLEEEFINCIKEINYWDFPKISLYAIEEILNFIDFLLEKFSKMITITESLEKNSENFIQEISKIDEKINFLLNFILLIIPNSTNKEIFCSFDNLSLIFKETLNLNIKSKIIEFFLMFTGVKKNTMDSYLDFVDYFTFGINIRPIIIEEILLKSRNLNGK
jgi:hypothetical protein